jgi:hypothetical protein
MEPWYASNEGRYPESPRVIQLTNEQRGELLTLAKRCGTDRVDRRARFVLYRARRRPLGIRELAHRFNVTRMTVRRWLDAFIKHGIDGLLGSGRLRLKAEPYTGVSRGLLASELAYVLADGPELDELLFPRGALDETEVDRELTR